MKPEPVLASPAKTREILQKYEIRAQKKFGQNFLVDARVAEGIVEAAGITEETCVLEIGPGIGTLTQYLAYAADRVIAVEIDRHLQPVLEETLAGRGNVQIIWGDVLKTDIPSLLAGANNAKIVANLPYYITTPILMELLERELPVSDITVMVQKEVADRMAAAPGSKHYGALSLAVQYRCETEVAFTVPPAAFLPRPEVDSAVVHLRIRESREPVQDEKQMFRIIRAAFGQRRKTLENALANAADLSCGKEEVRAAIASCGLPANVRGEALSLQEFAKLADRLPAGNKE